MNVAWVASTLTHWGAPRELYGIRLASGWWGIQLVGHLAGGASGWWGIWLAGLAKRHSDLVVWKSAALGVGACTQAGLAACLRCQPVLCLQHKQQR